MLARGYCDAAVLSSFEAGLLSSDVGLAPQSWTQPFNQMRIVKLPMDEVITPKLSNHQDSGGVNHSSAGV